MSKDLKLKVGELTDRGDFGKGLIRIGTDAMRSLGVREGDAVEIEGERKTVATAIRAYPRDIGLNIVRMDGILRKNSGVSIGEYVTINKVDVKEAKTVTLAPAKQGAPLPISADIVKRNLLMRPLTKGDIIVPSPMFRRRNNTLFEDFFGMDFDEMFFPSLGNDTRFVVASVTPKGNVRVTENTKIVITDKAVDISEERVPEVTYEDVGGLHEEVNKVREIIELPLKRPELFDRLGIEPPKGVLLHGPPGTGKTLLAKAVANEVGAHFITINGPEVMSKWYGESEKKLRKIFDDAEKNAPSIIFIDELDSIASKREEVSGEVERRVVSQMLTLMDGLKSRGKVIVIAATNRPNALDPALRRPGRFDREIEISVPNKKGRKEILQIHTRNMPMDKDVDLEELSDVTYGFVGADLSALSKEAAMISLRRILPDISSIEEGEPLSDELVQKLKVGMKDFENALKTVQPSAMREVLIEVPKVTWDDIGGLEQVKENLKEAVEWPLQYPDSFDRMGIRPPLGIMMYGPPGTGKTLLAKATANESGANFISIKGPELISKWVGESEKHIREVFRRAKQVSPCVIFFDEIDAIAPRRGMDSGDRSGERVVSQLLTELSGLEELHDVVVMAATNRPDMIDSALLRPGRFDRHIHVTAPDLEARKEILNVHTRDVPLEEDVSLDDLANETEGYSGADIESLVREAAMDALREDIDSDKVSRKHFEKALEEVNPSITSDMIQYYKGAKQRLKEADKQVPTYVG